MGASSFFPRRKGVRGGGGVRFFFVKRGSYAWLISGNGATQAGGKWVTRKHIRPTFASLTVGSPVPNSRRFIEGLVRESYKSTANPLQTLPWLRALSFVTQICRVPTRNIKNMKMKWRDIEMKNDQGQFIKRANEQKLITRFWLYEKLSERVRA